jgi:uncharacterized protein DUF4154
VAILKDHGRRSRRALSPLALLSRGLLAAVAVVSSGVAGVTGVAAARSPEPTAEYTLKAAFLFNFTKFVEWPADAFADEKSPFNLCILGEDRFGASLDAVVANESVNGRPIVVRRLPRGGEARACQILFLGRTERERQAEVLAGLRNAPVLTVGETDRFLDDGGLLLFFLEADRIRFAVNLRAVERTRLKISSKMLRLAKLVPEEHP